MCHIQAERFNGIVSWLTAVFINIAETSSRSTCLNSIVGTIVRLLWLTVGRQVIKTLHLTFILNKIKHLYV